MSDMFETVAAPTRSPAGRKPLPNPFRDEEVFPTTEGEARSVLVEEGENSTRARRLIRQARQAAKELGMSARVRVYTDNTHNDVPLPEGTVQLLFWTVERRTSKDSEE